MTQQLKFKTDPRSEFRMTVLLATGQWSQKVGGGGLCHTCTVLGPAEIELYITRLYRHRVPIKPRRIASKTHNETEMEFNVTQLWRNRVLFNSPNWLAGQLFILVIGIGELHYVTRFFDNQVLYILLFILNDSFLSFWLGVMAEKNSQTWRRREASFASRGNMPTCFIVVIKQFTTV